MNLANVTNTNATRFSRSEQPTLRQGQIIQGEVLKLYPENKAEIRLGGQRLIANLEVGLELGGRYHFQVTSNSGIPQLKVLGEQLQKIETVDLTRLLQQLGIKPNRMNLQLTQTLTRLSIPFDGKQLQQAATLLKGARNKALASTVLASMIAKKLPLTTGTFQSLLTSSETSLNEQLKTVLQQLKQAAATQTNQVTSERPVAQQSNTQVTEQAAKQSQPAQPNQQNVQAQVARTHVNTGERVSVQQSAPLPEQVGKQQMQQQQAIAPAPQGDTKQAQISTVPKETANTAQHQSQTVTQDARQTIVRQANSNQQQGNLVQGQVGERVTSPQLQQNTNAPNPISQPSVEQRLIDSISKLTERPLPFREALVQEIMTQNKANNPSLFQSLQGLGFVSSKVDFSTWVKTWNDFATTSQQQANSPLPFQLNDQTIVQTFSALSNVRESISQQAQQLLQTIRPQIQFHEMTGNPPPREVVTQLQRQWVSIVAPILTEEQVAKIQVPEQTRQAVSTFLAGIEAFTNRESSENLVSLAKQAPRDANFLSQSLQNQFLTHVKESMQTLGLDFENRMMTEKNPAEALQTIKSLLLQLGTNQSSVSSEQNAKLFQLIQGLQLQTTNDSLFPLN